MVCCVALKIRQAGYQGGPDAFSSHNFLVIRASSVMTDSIDLVILMNQSYVAGHFRYQ
jgi:hypothetical protein